PVLIVAECKDYKRRVGIDKVDELIGKIDDIRAVMGVLVSNSGFSEDAERRAAQDPRIQLASVVDVENDKIRAVIAIPFLCDFRAPELRLSVTVSAKVQFAPDDGFVADLRRRFIERWNAGKLDAELGNDEYTEVVRDDPSIK